MAAKVAHGLIQEQTRHDPAKICTKSNRKIKRQVYRALSRRTKTSRLGQIAIGQRLMSGETEVLLERSTCGDIEGSVID